MLIAMFGGMFLAKPPGCSCGKNHLLMQLLRGSGCWAPLLLSAMFLAACRAASGCGAGAG